MIETGSGEVPQVMDEPSTLREEEGPTVGEGASSSSASPRPIKALLASLVCPGLGEWILGRRRLALVFLGAFTVAAYFLLTGMYDSVHDIAVRVKTRDSSLDFQPRSGSEAFGLFVRLVPPILREYRKDSDRIRRQVTLPFYAILILYLWSMVQAFLMARRRRAEQEGVGSRPDPAARPP